MGVSRELLGENRPWYIGSAPPCIVIPLCYTPYIFYSLSRKTVRWSCLVAIIWTNVVITCQSNWLRVSHNFRYLCNNVRNITSVVLYSCTMQSADWYTDEVIVYLIAMGYDKESCSENTIFTARKHGLKQLICYIEMARSTHMDQYYCIITTFLSVMDDRTVTERDTKKLNSIMLQIKKWSKINPT